MASKGRNFCFLVYPEHFTGVSPYEIGMKFANALKVPLAMSPCHFQADEECGKPHFHFEVCLSGAKTNVQIYASLLASGLASSLAGYKESVTKSDIDHIVNLVSDKCAYMRYLVHLDQPEKEQFDGGLDCITFYNGLDIGDADKISKRESYKMMFEILEYVQHENISFFCDLINYSMYHRYDDWFKYLSEHGSLVREYMRSKVAKVNYELKSKEAENEKKEALNDCS